MARARAARLLLPVLLTANAHVASAQPAPAPGFLDPVDVPAASATPPAQAPLLALATAGQRLVAVGLRGRIVWSDDGGTSWTQARVPVEVDLVAVHFATRQHGWAVGHRGVLLHSADGGASWTRRFAGQQLNELALKHYQAQPAPLAAPAAQALASATRAIMDSQLPSLLDIWFESPEVGTLVGTFNTIFRTEDGGKSWTPWMDRVHNPEELHFYAVRGGGGTSYLTGEKGGVWRLDAKEKKAVAIGTGYAGTLFGLVVDGPRVLAYGMRGSVFASDDAGLHWRAVATPRQAGFTAGLRLRSGAIVLADQTGALLRSADGGRSFAPAGPAGGLPAFSLVQAQGGQVLSAGPAGVTRAGVE